MPRVEAAGPVARLRRRAGRNVKAAVLVLAVIALAVAVRLPYLQIVPVISDEAFEVLAARSMLGGPFIWFGPFDPTTGPLVTWLLALVFWLFGPSAGLARVVTMLIGAATAGLAFGLGRSLGSRAGSPVSPDGPATAGDVAGLLAGVLVALNPVHIVVNSHVAWSNSTTPFFATAAMLALHSAVRRANGRLLVLGGFLAGLALQTHISMLVLLPGLLAWFVLRRDILAWLRRPWPYLAAAAALLGYANMIVYNIISRGGALANVQQHTYAWEANPSLATYMLNLAALVTNTARTLGGQVPRVHDPLGMLVAGLLLAWLLAALIYTLKRRETMPILVILAAVLILPYFNKRYEGLLSQRYTAFLLPLCFAAMGRLAGDAVAWARGRARASAWAAVGLAVALLLAVYPLRNTLAHYRAELDAGRDNRLSIALVRHLEQELPPGTPLYISSGLKDKETGGGYRFVRAISYFLSMDGVEHRVLDPPDLAAQLAASPGQAAWVVLTAPEFEALAGQHGLVPLPGGPELPNEALVARRAAQVP